MAFFELFASCPLCPFPFANENLTWASNLYGAHLRRVVSADYTLGLSILVCTSLCPCVWIDFKYHIHLHTFFFFCNAKKNTSKVHYFQE